MTATDQPATPTIAAACAQALEQGDMNSARQLAEQGLRVATGAGNKKWVRRFEHLLRVAKGASIESLPYQPPWCPFCARRVQDVFAGQAAFICDECVRRCSSQRLGGSPITWGHASDVACSFCGRAGQESLFQASGSYICQSCVVAFSTELGA